VKSWKSNLMTSQTAEHARHILAIVVASSALAIGVAASGPVHAQSTGGSIFGWGPAGQTVTIHSSTGVRRHTTINDSGRYTLRSLPLGVYSVALEKDGNSVDERKNIQLRVGGGAEVDFACPNDQCAAAGKNQSP